MACSKLLGGPNDFWVDICLKKMASETGEKEKVYKDQKVNEILSTMCALLNSGGGQLSLHYGETSSKDLVCSCLRMIEQRAARVMNSSGMLSHLNFEFLSDKTIVIIKSSSCLITLNYNLYLPSESQVLTVPPSEPAESIKKVIIQRKIPHEKVVTVKSHHQHLTKGQVLQLRESCVVQLKNLKASPSKRVTLADRITGKTNRFRCYFSAFANRYGGHIYYGISDNREVEGENITEKEQNAIIKQVTKAINGMICPFFPGDKPQRGKQWDIYFEPVRDQSDNPIPSTFVIVIYVAPCPGGMFTESPESYHIVQGKVKRMSFHDWWGNFNSSTRHTQFYSVPSHVPCIAWSSEKNRKIYRILTAILVLYRNDQVMEKFERMARFAIEKYPNSVACLVVMSEEVTVASKNHHFKNASSTLKTFVNSVSGIEKDGAIFEVIELYLKSRLERAKGNIEESYKIAAEGLQKMQLIPAEFITVRFYVHAATLATILATTEHDPKKYDDLIHKGKQCLDLASRDANMVRTSDARINVDLQQKVRIYRAEAHMRCSLTGEASADRRNVTCEDLDNAASELAAVHLSNLNGHIPTHFRKIQYLLAHSDLYHQRSRRSEELCFEYLKIADKYARKALSLATKHKFTELIPYANKRLNVLQDVFKSAPHVNDNTDLQLLEDLDDF